MSFVASRVAKIIRTPAPPLLPLPPLPLTIPVDKAVTPPSNREHKTCWAFVGILRFWFPFSRQIGMRTMAGEDGGE